jgi:hypothetical protein
VNHYGSSCNSRLRLSGSERLPQTHRDPGIVTAVLRLRGPAAVQRTNSPTGGNQLPPQGGSNKSGGPGEGQRAGHTTRQRSTPVASGENSDDRDDRFILRAM